MAARLSDEHSSSPESSSEDERPNRWEGPSTTWQDMNREEISTLTALDEIRNRDLSVHLYNAFALKQRHGGTSSAVGDDGMPVPERDINAATGETVRPDDWLPQRSWTAWPMSWNKVPPDNFIKRPENGDDKFTITQSTQKNPSSALEEAVGAAILKFAQEKFESRPWEDAEAEAASEDEDKTDEGEDGMSPSDLGDDGTASRSNSRSRSRSTSRPRVGSIKQESGSEDHRGRKTEEMNIEIDESDTEEEKGPSRLQQLTLKPAVSADDDLSYNLMRPAVRHILSQLDAALMVLHNSRATTVNYLSDSSSDDDSGDPATTENTGRSRSKGSEPPVKRRRGRPAKAGLSLRIRRPPPPEDNKTLGQEVGQVKIKGTDAATNQDPPLKPKVGRPKKVYPRLQGETDKEYAIRIAKLRKEPTPYFPDDDIESGGPQSSDSEAPPRPGHATKRKPLESRERYPDESIRKKIRLEKNRARLGLRDWKDVIGAAALAGFPQAALDRAARRCADLFGQNMELRTMTEAPLGTGEQEELIQYHPGMTPNLAAEMDPEGTDSEEEKLSQVKRRIRSCSVVSDDLRGRSKSRSPSRSRTRSRSVSAACSHFCSVRGCARGTDGFSRRSNLLRHMKLVHHLDEDDLPTDVDSEDEMVGAVHVDGFLKPIKIRRGWRGDDVRADSSSKRRYGGRQRKRERSRSADGTGHAGDQDVDMADVDS